MSGDGYEELFSVVWPKFAGTKRSVLCSELVSFLPMRSTLLCCLLASSFRPLLSRPRWCAGFSAASPVIAGAPVGARLLVPWVAGRADGGLPLYGGLPTYLKFCAVCLDSWDLGR